MAGGSTQIVRVEWEPGGVSASSATMSGRDRALLERMALTHVLVSLLVAGLLAVRASYGAAPIVVFQGSTVLCDLLSWWLARHGRVRAGTWLMVATLTLPSLLAPAYLGGLTGHVLMTVVVAVMLAGVLLGWRQAVVVAVFTGVVTLAYALAQDGGHLTANTARVTGLDAFTSVASALTMCIVLLSQSVRALREALEKAQLREAERDEATRKFLTTQKMELVGRLASGIAHDFNNLLSVIRGGTEFITMSQPPSDELTSALQDIEGATERAALMSRTLLTLGHARVDEPNVTLDLSAVVSNQAKLLPRLLGSRIAVDCVTPKPVYVRATPASLEQIVLNLAVNARDAMPSGGTLALAVREEGDRARLDVRDTGMGMPEAVRARMFEPFFTTRATGTGLGLATVKELVNRFEGSVTVESEVGQGSCFTIRLPLAPAPTEPVPAQVLPTHSVRRRRVLLVEDNELVRRDLTKLMLVAGLDVTAVCDGDEALALLEGARGIDAVLTDLSMPRVAGDTMANAMRARGLRVPVIFFSGNAAPSTLPENTSFLPKPVAMAALAAELERVCLPR